MVIGGAGCRNDRVGSAGVGVCAFHPCIFAGCTGAKKWIYFAGVALSCCFDGSLAIPAKAPVVFSFVPGKKHFEYFYNSKM